MLIKYFLKNNEEYFFKLKTLGTWGKPPYFIQGMRVPWPMFTSSCSCIAQ